MTVFALVLLILFPLLVFAVLSKNERIIYYAHFLPTIGARFMLFVFGVRLVIHNKELIDAKGQYIYISNHRSYLDAFVAGGSIPNFTKFLGKAEILSWPIMGYLMKNFYVPVWRKDKDHRSWSMAEMNKLIKTGCSFFICPEGTCNIGTDFFIRFYDGAFKLSIETGFPVVPLTFIRTGEIMPRNGLLLLPGTVHVYWHEPIPASGISYENIEEVKERVRNIMREDLLKHYPDGKYPLQN
jgi:1-acyl-sn-glycerol-3-phosphate acyltransferase